MPRRYVKPITSNFDLLVAMRNSIERSIQHHPPPPLAAVPMEFTQLPGSKTANQALETKGYAVVEELVEAFLLDLGVLKESHSVFYEVSSSPRLINPLLML